MRDDASINDYLPLSMSCKLGVVSNDIIMDIWMSEIIRKVIIIRPLSGSFVRCLQINVPLLQIVLVCCCWPIINLQYRQFLMVDPASIGCNVYILWYTSYTIHPTTHILCLDICLFLLCWAMLRIDWVLFTSSIHQVFYCNLQVWLIGTK